MYVRLDERHEGLLRTEGVVYAKLGGALYVAIKELKCHFDKLRADIDLPAVVRFDNLVFSADFTKIRDVSSPGVHEVAGDGQTAGRHKEEKRT